VTNNDGKRSPDDLDDLDAFLASITPSSASTPRPATPGSTPGTARPALPPAAADPSDVDVDLDFEDDGATTVGQIPLELLAALGRSPKQQHADTVPPPAKPNARFEPTTLPPSTLPPPSALDVSWDDDADLELESITLPPPVAPRAEARVPPRVTTPPMSGRLSTRPSTRPTDDEEDRPTIGFDRPPSAPPTPRSEDRRLLSLRPTDPPLGLDDPFAEPTSSPPPEWDLSDEGESISLDEDVAVEAAADVAPIVPAAVAHDDDDEASITVDDDEPLVESATDDDVSIDTGGEILLDGDDDYASVTPARAAETKQAAPIRREAIMTLSGREQFAARSELLVTLSSSATEPFRSEALVAAAEFAERAGQTDRAVALLEQAASRSTTARRALVRLGRADAVSLLGDELGGDVAAVHGAATAVEALREGDERAALVALDDAWSKAIDPRLRVLLASAGADLARSLGDAQKAASMRIRSLDETASTGSRVAAARELLELGDRAAASDVLLHAAEIEPRPHPAETLRRLGRRLAGHDPDGTSTLVASDLTAAAAAMRGDSTAERAALDSFIDRTTADDRARALTRLAVLDALEGHHAAAVSALEEARKLASRSAFVDSTRDALAAHLGNPDSMPPTPLHSDEDAPIAALGRALAKAGADETTLEAIEAARGLARARGTSTLLAADVAANLGEPAAWTSSLASEADETAVGVAGLGVARAVVFARAGATEDAVDALGTGTLDLADAARALLLASSDRTRAADALEASESASLHERLLRSRIATESSVDELTSLAEATNGDIVTTLRLEQSARRELRADAESEALERLASLASDERDRTMLRLLAASVGGGSKADIELAPNDPVLLAEALVETSPSDETRNRAIERLGTGATPAIQALLHTRASSLATIADKSSDAASAARASLEFAPDDPSAIAAVDLAELGADESARLIERLFTIARGEGDPSTRARAYARIADIDRRETRDVAAALASVGATLELAPGHVPSLRALEVSEFERGSTESIGPVESKLALGVVPGRAADAHSRLAISSLYAGAADPIETIAPVALQALARGTRSVRLLRWAEHAGRGTSGLAEIDAIERRLEASTDAAERVELWLRLAAVAERRGLNDRAYGALAEAHALEPGHPVVVFERAMAADRLPDDREAASAHEIAADSSTSPTRASFHRLRAAARLVTIGALDDARNILDAARAADPRNADVLTALVEIHERRNDARAALDAVGARIALGGTPESLATANELRGRLAERVGDSTLAREAYAAALVASPDDTSVLRRAADLALADGDGRTAIDFLIRLARIERGRDELKRIFLELGDSYERLLPDARRAEASYRRVLQLDATHERANARLVAVLASGGNVDDALTVADQFEHAAPDSPVPMQLRFSVARAIEKSGDARKAEHLLEDLRKRAPTYVPLVLELADFYARQGARPALAMHLGRAAAEMRRAFEEASTRENLECLVEVQRRRGRADTFACTSSAAAAVGLTTDATGAPLATFVEPLGRRARSNEIDDLVAPRVLTESTRAALRLASESIERAFPLDQRPFKVEKAPRDSTLRTEARAVAEWFGFDDVQVLMTPVAPRICVPVSAHPLTIIVGTDLPNASTPEERTFLFVRAAKIAASGLAFAMRLPAPQVVVAMHALVRANDPNHQPDGVDRAAVEETAARLARHLPKGELHALCIEMASRPEFDPARFGVAAAEWADRVALLATGKPSAALAGLIHLAGQNFAEAAFDRRVALLRGTPEAFGLLSFALADTHAEARTRGARG